MSEKLTLQDCFKYPNAKLILTYPAEITETYLNTKEYKNIYYWIYERGMFQTKEDYSISDCKLILRPLSSLTDEEKKVIRDKWFGEKYGYDLNDLTFEKLSEIIYFNNGFWGVKDFYDWCRENNFDIDNLQKRGLCEYE